ncbi:SBBP repeat-containing protein [Myxococcus sp. K15C18031901]|uniref:SBBP repeat-containing protein n=1 Tax=Myxococcus dinghuensis TaxID=2906761 RepID=UPI0020A72620|nr:SBBP repeat-containing protein [Myxococcus dinghuensis]MCP3105494.1 SBBP repeat-containing protein [Myxococcus dinghuensis]
MRHFNIIRSTLLTSTLLASSLPGCQGPDAPDVSPPEETGTTSQPLVCGTIVPVMTGPTTPGGSVVRSGAYSAAYEAWMAFDNSSSYWVSEVMQTPAWIGYQPVTTTTLHRYALVFHNGPDHTARAPKDWTFQGFNGSSWVVLDTRNNQTNWAGYERREFTLSSPATYVRYRLHVTDDNDAAPGVHVVSLRTLELITCVNDGVPNPVSAQWTQTFGATGASTQVLDLAGDSTGNTYVTGYTGGALNGTPMVGLLDSFLQARNAGGTLLWSKPIGAPGNFALGYGIATGQASDDVYVAGYTAGSVDGTPIIGQTDAFVTKYRKTGVRQWTRQVGGAGFATEGYDVAVDASDNVFLVGVAEGGLDGNTRVGNRDMIVTKFDTAGNKLWTRQTGAAGKNTQGRRAATDAAGNVFVSGWTEGGMDGNALMGVQDFFVVKYDSAGNKLWTRQLGSSGNAVWLYGSATDAAGNVYLTGQSGGGLDGNPNTTAAGDVFLSKYDTSGTRQWTREFSATNGIFASGLFIDASGVYVSGGGRGDVGNPSNTTYSVAHNYIAKFDTAGTRQWVLQQNPAMAAGAPSPVYSNGVSRASSGAFYLGGYTSGNFDGNVLFGDTDGFVTKLPAQ